MSNFIVSSSLLSAIPVSVDDQRYITAEAEIEEILISSDGQRANVSGAVTFNIDPPFNGTVWVSAFAYDTNNNIVGIRKWIANENVLESSEKINFNVDVYSLGLPINDVEVLPEVRP